VTWSKFDDAAPKNPKAVAAGNDAWGLWAAAVMYCNRHLTDGYVTLAALATDCLPVPITPARAKKLAEQLCGSRVRPDGKGLFEPAGDGLYLVHDFHDWNPSKVEVETRRKIDRDRKKNPPGRRMDSDRNTDGDPSESGRSSGGIQEDSEAPRASARALPARPVPTSHSQPSHHQSESGGGESDEGPWEERSHATPCPLDLDQKLIARGVHVELAQQLKADVASVALELKNFRNYWVVGKGSGQSRSFWAGKARQWVCDAAAQNKLATPGAPERESETRLRLARGPRQPNHTDHTDPNEHFAAIGAIEV
jgi:hypothetical protein